MLYIDKDTGKKLATNSNGNGEVEQEVEEYQELGTAILRKKKEIYASLKKAALFASMALGVGFFKNITIGNLNVIDKVTMAVSGVALFVVFLMSLFMIKVSNDAKNKTKQEDRD